MGKNAFMLSTADFDKKFLQLAVETVPNLAAEGMFHAGAVLVRDAITEPPFAPHKKGYLWRSARVEKPVQFGSTKQAGWIEVVVGFNIIYAAYLHEKGKATWNWTLTGSGPKYLATKLASNPGKYTKIAADYVRSKGGGA